MCSPRPLPEQAHMILNTVHGPVSHIVDNELTRDHITIGGVIEGRMLNPVEYMLVYLTDLYIRRYETEPAVDGILYPENVTL